MVAVGVFLPGVPRMQRKRKRGGPYKKFLSGWSANMPTAVGVHSHTPANVISSRPLRTICQSPPWGARSVEFRRRAPQ